MLDQPPFGVSNQALHTRVVAAFNMIRWVLFAAFFSHFALTHASTGNVRSGAQRLRHNPYVPSTSSAAHPEEFSHAQNLETYSFPYGPEASSAIEHFSVSPNVNAQPLSFEQEGNSDCPSYVSDNDALHNRGRSFDCSDQQLVSGAFEQKGPVTNSNEYTSSEIDEQSDEDYFCNDDYCGATRDPISKRETERQLHRNRFRDRQHSDVNMPNGRMRVRSTVNRDGSVLTRARIRTNGRLHPSEQPVSQAIPPNGLSPGYVVHYRPSSEVVYGARTHQNTPVSSVVQQRRPDILQSHQETLLVTPSRPNSPPLSHIRNTLREQVTSRTAARRPQTLRDRIQYVTHRDEPYAPITGSIGKEGVTNRVIIRTPVVAAPPVITHNPMPATLERSYNTPLLTRLHSGTPLVNRSPLLGSRNTMILRPASQSRVPSNIKPSYVIDRINALPRVSQRVSDSNYQYYLAKDADSKLPSASNPSYRLYAVRKEQAAKPPAQRPVQPFLKAPTSHSSSTLWVRRRVAEQPSYTNRQYTDTARPIYQLKSNNAAQSQPKLIIRQASRPASLYSQAASNGYASANPRVTIMKTRYPSDGSYFTSSRPHWVEEKRASVPTSRRAGSTYLVVPSSRNSNARYYLSSH